MTGQRQWNSTLGRSKGLRSSSQLARVEFRPGTSQLRRKTPMGRGSVTILGSNVVPLERPAPRAARPKPRKAPSPELTFTPEVEALIFQAHGGRCFLAGWADPPCRGLLAAHHRELKGMGGSKRAGLHVASNGIVLCQAHHSWTHLHPLEAKGYKLILPRNRAHLPSTQLPVSADRRTWRWLTDDGRMLTEAPPPEPLSVA